MILKADDGIKIGKDIYLMCRDINIIYRVNLEEKRILLYGSIPEEDITAKRLCAKIINWKDELFFIPFNAKKLWILNMKTHTWRNLNIKRINVLSEALFFQAVIFEKHLFLIGSGYSAILDIDLETEQISYISGPYSKKGKGDILFRCSYTQKEEYLYLASCLSNEILLFNMKTYEYKWITVGKENNRYVGIVWDGNYFWIAPRYHTAIVKWDGGEEVAEYELKKELQNEKQGFIGIDLYEDGVILPAMLPAQTIIIPNYVPEEMHISCKSFCFFKAIEKNEYIYMETNGKLHIEDKNRKEIIDCQLTEDQFKSNFQGLKCNSIKYFGRVTKEDDIVDLDFLTEYIVEDITQRINDEKNSGKNIWSRMEYE